MKLQANCKPQQSTASYIMSIAFTKKVHINGSSIVRYSKRAKIEYKNRATVPKNNIQYINLAVLLLAIE